MAHALSFARDQPHGIRQQRDHTLNRTTAPGWPGQWTRRLPRDGWTGPLPGSESPVASTLCSPGHHRLRCRGCGFHLLVDPRSQMTASLTCRHMLDALADRVQMEYSHDG